MEVKRYVDHVLVQHTINGVAQMPGLAQIAHEWPIWAKALKKFATPEDKGIGDVVARMIGDEKSEAFKAWHLVTFGKACNCTDRRERWNRLYPLNQ